jgi:hypothetical protein
MAMAGCYQTIGERANVPGMGGWITGRGNQEMTMLKGYAHMRGFFEKIEWWKLEPRQDLVSGGDALCLASVEAPFYATYVVYLPKGGTTKLTLGGGNYSPRLFNPRTGESDGYGTAAGNLDDDTWVTPETPDQDDWVWLVRRFR